MPPECERVVGFIDVGQYLLWWVVAAFDEHFGCHVIGYGPYPEQSARVFTSRTADPTLADRYRDAGSAEGVLYNGLSELTGKLCSREWVRSDGAAFKLSRLLVDCGWNSDLVRLFARQSPHRDVIQVSKGFGVSATQSPIGEWQKKPGERVGRDWILGVAGADRLRLLRFDSNAWKTRLCDMMTRSMGTRGCLMLFGDSAAEHELMALHLCSEFPTRVEGKGRTVDVWARRPDAENHLLDGALGCLVAASLEGVTPVAGLNGDPARAPRRRVSFAELQRQARGRP
jgi:hypothetical protein